MVGQRPVTSIRLVGRPALIDADGMERRVRGFQTWALLARLVLSDRPVFRRDLASELFADASDPLASLRWCLAELRKAFGSKMLFLGDPIVADLPPDTKVDLVELMAGRFDSNQAGEFLASIEPRCSAEFETWLFVQRQRVASMIDEVMRREIMDALAVGANERALANAELLARRSPYDESAHVLLVKSLIAAGHHDAAVVHVADVEARMRAEFGVDLSAALRSAARANVAAAPLGVSAHALAVSLCDSGLAAIAAGATDAGLDCLRRAVGSSETLGDEHLHARCLFELGTALVHSVRGRDDEGAVLLARAAQLAERHGDRRIAAEALRELGCVDALVGRRPTAAHHLGRGIEHAGTDPDLLAGLHAVNAFNIGDWGRTEAAIAEYQHALELARTAGNTRRQAWTLALGGWLLARTGDDTQALVWLDECMQQVEQLSWLAFRPWPLSIIAEINLQRSNDVSLDQLEQNFATSCHLADPCWEGMTARNLAIAHAAQRDLDVALDWIATARSRCTRDADSYVAIIAAIYETEAAIANQTGDVDRAQRAARDLVALAARTHMDGYLERGLHLAGPLLRSAPRQPDLIGPDHGGALPRPGD